MDAADRLPDDALAQPTRARLFRMLEELKKEAATEELAAELGLHVNGVRRHLELLADAGLLERTRRRHGRGRPRDHWSVVVGARSSGTQYADLAGWLAGAIPDSASGRKQVERAGREIGRSLAPDAAGDSAAAFERVMAALGFRPLLEVGADDVSSCQLRNCPYAESVIANPAVVCGLHRAITAGLLESLAPEAKLTRFEPHDPEEAGCLVEVTGAGWSSQSVVVQP